MTTTGLPAGGHQNHYCEFPDCEEWGAFGYSQGKDTPSRWFCGSHRLRGWRQGDPIIVPPAAVPAF